MDAIGITPLPALCADRIDYTFRDLYTYGMISKQEVLTFLIEHVRLCNQKAKENFNKNIY
ncbi:hypothetical protein AAIE21_03945 [Paenibacillus sp. 102]|uniref:hypothetical protein n=1 Tax=Paenibacillus sp. 102 TaxID=3120823 RepID=UPI0031BB7EEF